MSCQKCSLYKYRTNIVLGEGPVPCDIMLVGEAPGKDEDITGRPFVGMAGKVLEMMLEYAGMKRTQVYITNTVKCRPPNNREPTVEERLACRSCLDEELESVRPKRILALGKTALSSFSDSGKDFEVWPLYHPAYALYSGDYEVMRKSYKRALIDDET